MRPEVHTAAQSRLVDELLGWDLERPDVPSGLVDDLRRRLEDGVRPVLADLPAGADRWVGPSTLLRAVRCAGWYVHDRDMEVVPTPAMLVRALVRRAVVEDWRTQRLRTPAEVVDVVARELASGRSRDAGAYNALPPADVAGVHADVAALVAEVRDAWPALPAEANPRIGSPVRVRVAEGRVVLGTVPDLVLGGVRDEAARLLPVALRTGPRRAGDDLALDRVTALLLTLRAGQPPFRWASYYVPEGDWHLEDLDVEVLHATVDWVVVALARARALARMREVPEADRRPGGHCQRCGLVTSCAVAETGARTLA